MNQFLSSLTPLTCASVGMGVLTAVLFFRVFFDDLSDFLDCLRLALQPDFISLIRGEWNEMQWSGAKLLLYLLPSLISGWVAYSQFPKWWPSAFH